MSRPLTLEQIEVHMRAQTSEFLQGFLDLLDGLDSHLENHGATTPGKNEDAVRGLAVKILEERRAAC